METTNSYTLLICFISFAVLLVTCSTILYSDSFMQLSTFYQYTIEKRSSQPSYVLYHRRLLWVKQSAILLSSEIMCYNTFSQILANYCCNLEIVASIVCVISLLLLLFFDDINNIGNKRNKILFLPSYILVVVYSATKYLFCQSASSLIELLAASVSASLCITYTIISTASSQLNPPTAEYKSNLFMYCTFSYLNSILIQPGRVKSSLEFDDVPTFGDDDTAACVWDKFQLLKKHGKVVNMTSTLFKLVFREWFHQGCFQFISSCAQFMAPLALERILLHISNNGQDDDEVHQMLPISANLAILLLFIGPVLKGITDGQNYQRGRHIGVRVKSALIVSIYNKSLSVDMTSSNESIGKLNNLISVDVSEIQNLSCYSHFLWSSPFEMVVTSLLLFFVLGNAAWSGLLVMVVALLIGFLIAERLEHFQTTMLGKKDTRIGLVNEVMNSMRIIKYFAWEEEFMSKIVVTRKDELKSLKYYSFTNAVLDVLWDIVPALVGATAFFVHRYLLGQPLTPSVGFTALTLFNLLRYPLQLFPIMINLLVRSRASLRRIESFMSCPDVKGISRSIGQDRPSDPQPLYPSTPHLSPTSRYDAVKVPRYSARADRSGVGEVSAKKLTLGWNSLSKEMDKIEQENNSTALASSYFHCFQNLSVRDLCWSRGGSRPSKYVLLPNEDELGDITLKLLGCQQDGLKAKPPSNSFVIEENEDDVDVEANYSGNGSKAGRDKQSLLLPRFGSKRQQKPRPGRHDDASIQNNLRLVDVTKWKTQERKSDDPPRPLGSGGRNRVFDGNIVVRQANVTVPPGGLTLIVGMTGAGKSTFLLGGLLGECPYIEGQVGLSGKVSYVPQSAWIQNATVRDNILFGSEFEKERYEKVLYACSLNSDLSLLPYGDQTEIGEKGVNLSGGQQQRVSLARAAYSKGDIILMDDPLSAVDSHVAEHIFQQLICRFLSDRTRLLVTHNLALTIAAADQVVCLDGLSNRVVACCPPADLPSVLAQHSRGLASFRGSNEGFETEGSSSSKGVFFEALISTANDVVAKQSSAKMQRDSVDKLGNCRQETSTQSLHHIQSLPLTEHAVGPTSTAIPGVYSIETVAPSQSMSHNDCSFASLLAAEVQFKTAKDAIHDDSTMVSLHNRHSSDDPVTATTIHATSHPKADSPSTTSAPGGGIVAVETKASGDVAWGVYWFYLKACGGLFCVVTLVALSLLICAAWLSQNYGLGYWIRSIEERNGNEQFGFIIYLVCVVSVVVTTLSRIIAQVIFALAASQKLHDRLMKSVVLAPCSWFDATPIGRIINRFSQDVSTVDSELMKQLMGFLDCLLGVMQIVVIICYYLPLLLIAFLPILAITVWVSYQYLRVSRELKRLESVKKSPVFVLFSESLQGLSVIRAFRQENRFFKICCNRVDEMNRCHLYMWLCNRWLNFRMQMLCSVIVGAVGWAVVVDSGHTIGSTAAGVLLIYSLSFCDNLTFLSRCHAECQMGMNSVERLQEYSKLPTERQSSVDPNHTKYDRNTKDGALPSPKQKSEAVVDRSGSMPQFWPSQGRVEFQNICLRYSSSAHPVLRDVSFCIPGMAKVGVVGRTGAGKSSLITALFRLEEPCSGQLVIDGIDVLNVSLPTLRGNIAIVPQEPTLFRGTVRFNLDPFDEHTDDEIWAALKSVHLSEYVAQMETSDPSSRNPEEAIRGQHSEGYRSPPPLKIAQEEYSLSNKYVSEKGSNFSVGQRQLLCLARALLRPSKVLVLDECTASVDQETDALIQETVRNEIKASTVICIAHRLRTIAYYDYVLVMEKGSVAEYDEPLKLMDKMDSVFRNMCLTSGDFDELYALAKATYDSKHNIRLNQH